MVTSDTLSNLAAYAIQMAAVAALAELLLRIVPVTAAGFRYAYWRLVLLGALVTPWLLRAGPGAVSDVVSPQPAASLSLESIATLSAPSAEWAGPVIQWQPLVVWTLVAGIIARVLWVASGLARLRSLRRRGVTLVDPAYQEIQQTLGTHAEIRSVPGLPQPVTFGVLRPVVLLPEDLDASPQLRRAVVTHELFHVRRRDWLWMLAEEATRAVLWFHPAIWWLTSRVQLAREEFTDHLTVLATGSRRGYMEALTNFSESAPLAGAPAFARRSQLFHRIVMLSKEAAMSSRRIVVSGAVVAALLVTGGWYVSEAFPVVKVPAVRAAASADAQLPAGQAATPNSVTPENPIPRRLFSTPIPFPAELNDSGFTAALEMNVVLGAGGSVQSATRGSIAISGTGPRGGGPGPSQDDVRRAADAFSEAASNAIRQWQYDPPARAPLQFYVAVVFAPGQNATVTQSDASRAVSAGAGGVRVGGAAAFLPRVPSPNDARAAADRPSPAQPVASQPIRIGGQIRAPLQIRRVNPLYPEIAKSARVQGVVIVELVINERGLVTDARILRSIPLLDQAALDAVYQWEYSPTLLNGVPVPVIMTATVQFTLDQ